MFTSQTKHICGLGLANGFLEQQILILKMGLPTTALRSNPARHLFLYGPQTKNDFYIVK